MKLMIMMGSQTNEGVMQESPNWLQRFGIENEIIVTSAHTNPDMISRLMVNAKQNGSGNVIAAAGMAAYTSQPVQLQDGLPDGIDALQHIEQMPAGLPVGTLAVGKAGARNAAVRAARIFALSDPAIAIKVEAFKTQGYMLAA
ncbi:MAG: 5-(carboxyamino)imidazole ribonucleotide mutase [Sphingobacteriales bacterium]|nr:MAG: 5-(carboxyamino)imidazole ribonucleotide mutase [Sphingobacteriales bacterium]